MEDEKKEQKKRGRRTDCFSKYVQAKIQRLAPLGLTNRQIAIAVDVTEQTFYNWQRKYPDFFAELKKCKKSANRVVEASCYLLATGYSVPEDKVFIHEGQPVIVPTIKHYPPDAKAIALWLKNREPEKWREKVDIEHSGGLKIEVVRYGEGD
jgi:hypothetical protein